MWTSWSHIQGQREVSLHVGDLLQHAVRHVALVRGLATKPGCLVLQTLHLGRVLIIPGYEEIIASEVIDRPPGNSSALDFNSHEPQLKEPC